MRGSNGHLYPSISKLYDTARKRRDVTRRLLVIGEGPSLPHRHSRAALGNPHHGQQHISTFHINIDSQIYLTPMDPAIQVYRTPSNSSSRQGHPPVCPPPPQAVFPIPRGFSTENSSGTSSSGSKRKRAVVNDGSDAGRSRTRVSSTSDFNNNTKAQVREQYNNKCWHCGASPADICHIIGSRDHTVSSVCVQRGPI